MKQRLFTFVFLFIFSISLVPAPALADGIIIPEPPICITPGCQPEPIPMEQLAIRYHRVEVSIIDQVAITRVDQVFFNPNDWQIEGTYLFPIPPDSAVSNFSLWIDGQAVEGQVLDAEQARQTYEQIVSTMRDPALLEYAGRGALQARIFPIPPGGERRIQLEYTQVLTADNGLVKYTYPLNTEKFSVLPLDNVAISVDITSNQEPIRAVYSPTHKVDVQLLDDHNTSAGYEASNLIPDSDFSLFYSIGQSEAFHLLTYRDGTDPLDPDGFFMLLLAPRPDASKERLAKDVILVLDHSGSMDGEKFQQAQQAARFILSHLNPEDRFNIVNFSTSVDLYSPHLVSAQESASATSWIDTQSAMGSTDINRALLEAAALGDGEHPTYIIFMTDGLPTEGVTDSQQILDNFTRQAPKNLRLFVFGVGYDVDTFLLDSLAQEHHGTSTYVLPGDRLDEVLSSFFARISTPVLTDLELEFGNLPVYDVYPAPLPDLFAGSQIVVTGRYRKPGVTTIQLKGEVNGQVQTFTYPEQVFPERATTSQTNTLPRLWATRKIGHLLNEIRLHGADKEIIAQIVRLSIRYGIVTPYTSYLVTEEMPLGISEQQRIAEEQYSFYSTTTPAVSGAPAVQQAADQGELAGAEAPAPYTGDSDNKIKTIGAHTFILNNGIWVDTAFDPEQMETTQVPFLSQDYFALSQARPQLASAFALGEQVIAVSDGVAYQVVPSNENTDPVVIPPTLTPEQGGETGQPGAQPTQQPRSPASLPCASSWLALLPIGLMLFRKRTKNS